MPLLMRCPECGKLFSVLDEHYIGIKEGYPKMYFCRECIENERMASWEQIFRYNLFKISSRRQNHAHED